MKMTEFYEIRCQADSDAEANVIKAVMEYYDALPCLTDDNEVYCEHLSLTAYTNIKKAIYETLKLLNGSRD